MSSPAQYFTYTLTDWQLSGGNIGLGTRLIKTCLFSPVCATHGKLVSVIVTAVGIIHLYRFRIV